MGENIVKTYINIQYLIAKYFFRAATKLFSSSINLPTVFMINRFIVCSMKCQKSAKNAHLSFPEPSVTCSDCFFCPNNSPKHEDSSFIFISDTEKQQILTFKRLNQQFFLLFNSKNDLNN